MKRKKQLPKLADTVRPAVALHRGPAAVSVEPGGLGGGIVGMTTFDGKGKVARIIVPGGDDAYSRTVRLHEMLHANRSIGSNKAAEKYGVSRGTADAIEDCYVHLAYWPSGLGAAAHRDASSVALRDLRGLVREAKHIQDPSNPDAFNSAMAVAVRSIAIARQSHRHGEKGPFNHSRKMCERVFGSDGVFLGLWKVLDYVSSDSQSKKRMTHKGEAMRLFQSLLRKMPEQKLDPEDYKDGGPNAPDREDGETDEKNPMLKFCLSLAENTNNEEPNWSTARSGSRIRVSRFAHARATGSAEGLFDRERIMEAQGTVLIDASSSMHANSTNLAALCKAAPGATVAYYSGNDCARSGNVGELVVFAYDGRRASEIPVDHRPQGGNAVDWWALQWLLEQTGPLYLVTDLDFCGGPTGQEFKAMALLQANRERVTVLDSIRGATRTFQAMRDGQSEPDCTLALEDEAEV